jgi:fructose-1,6-bisphosphatase/inositol monophosphatase family enzyme
MRCGGRACGDFLSYCLVAKGAVDIAAEPEVSVWDLATLDILVREARQAHRLGRHRRPAPGQRRGHERPAAQTGAQQHWRWVTWR